MRGLPVEFLLLLLFGAFIVFNIAMQRAARRRQAEAAQHPPPDEMDDEDDLEALPPAPLSVPVPAPRPPAKRATAAAMRPTGRRFSRQTLFGTRRKAQDAFVVATILGRCRADEPHEVR